MITLRDKRRALQCYKGGFYTASKLSDVIQELCISITNTNTYGLPFSRFLCPATAAYDTKRDGFKGMLNFFDILRCMYFSFQKFRLTSDSLICILKKYYKKGYSKTFTRLKHLSNRKFAGIIKLRHYYCTKL